MRRFFRRIFGLDPEMLFAERVARITISVSLVIMMLAPVPVISFCGAGPFAFFFPLVLLPGFYTLRGTCRKVNPFHFLLIAGCTSAALVSTTLALVPILLFCFLLYFQAERRLYYLLELQKSDLKLKDSAQDVKKFCKAYLLNCCKNAILPTIAGSLIATVIRFFQGQIAWFISGGISLLFLGSYFFSRKHSQ